MCKKETTFAINEQMEESGGGSFASKKKKKKKFSSKAALQGKLCHLVGCSPLTG